MSKDLVQQSPRPPVAKRKAKPPVGVTPLVSRLLDAMVQEGLRYQDAAARIGMHIRHARKAIDTPTVLQELNRRKHIFRESLCAANPLRLAQLRDQNENRAAAVKAIQVLEQMPEDAPALRGVATLPGITVVINANPREHTRGPMIDLEPAEDT